MGTSKSPGGGHWERFASLKVVVCERSHEVDAADVRGNKKTNVWSYLEKKSFGDSSLLLGTFPGIAEQISCF